MGKIKEYYQEQIDNDDYYFEPEVEYHMTYAGRYGKYIPKIWNWFEKKYCVAQLMKNYKQPRYIKAEREECPF